MRLLVQSFRKYPLKSASKPPLKPSYPPPSLSAHVHEVIVLVFFLDIRILDLK